MVAELRHVAGSGDEYDALELFKALCDYLDELYGGTGFDRLLDPGQRTAVASVVRRIHGAAPTGSATLDDDGVPVDLSGPDADPVYDGVLRLDQPVNSAVTLREGRRLAADLAGTDGWQAEVGKALQGLYTYLDELYGGPGAFADLLTPDERAEVAAQVS